MSDVLYQKIGLVVNRLAQDFMSREVGERIPSISEYQENLQVSRGTVQNSLTYLKERGAVSLVSRGHMGTFIEQLDYRRLQECSLNKGLLGSMPLPYSMSYQGLATALYQVLSHFEFNLVYTRGSESRLQLVAEGVYQFTVCSRYAAVEAMKNHTDIEIAVDFGPGTYLSRHVLLLRDQNATGIEAGMRVAYDRTSLDQRDITGLITAGMHGIRFVELRAHQTVNAIRAGVIDAGVWNMDEIVESGYQGLHILPLDDFIDVSSFSSAVLVVRRGDEALCQMLKRYVNPAEVRRIQNGVKGGEISADY